MLNQKTSVHQTIILTSFATMLTGFTALAVTTPKVHAKTVHEQEIPQFDLNQAAPLQALSQPAQSSDLPGVSSPVVFEIAQSRGALASANDKYHSRIQTMTCPSDGAKYGNFFDYGYWGGGPWCGQTGRAGYWVWVNPNWYVWQSEVPPIASANGKYQGLTQVMNCPSDSAKYGNFYDYGYWGGGSWCGQTGRAGNWVWVNPNWYVWQN